MRHQQKNSRQALLAGVEKLIDQIVLIPDVSLQQILNEHGRQFRFQTQRFHHRRLLNVEQDAVRHCDGRRHAGKLAGKTTFSEEIAFAQNANRCFFSGFRYYAEPDLPFFHKEQAVGRISLTENRTLLLNRHHLSTLTDRRKKDVGIEFNVSLRRFALLFQEPSDLAMLSPSTMGHEDEPRLVTNAHKRATLQNLIEEGEIFLPRRPGGAESWLRATI
jgi:hypothetical protein